MRKRVSILLFLTLFIAGTARAEPIFYSAFLEGAAENPPNDSDGFGFAAVAYDPVLQTLEVLAGFSGLTTPVTAAHIHCCVDPPANAGVATPVPSFPGFPTDVFGFYNEVFNLNLLSSFNPDFVTAHGGTAAAAAAALAAGLAAGQAYFNIHTQQFPGGEIRGFLTASATPEPVPEPATMLLMGSGLGLLAAARRRKRRNSVD